MGIRAVVVVPLALWGLVTTSTGQSDPPIGAQVVTKFKTPLRVGDRVVDEGSAFHIYKVSRRDGDWLWLTSGRLAGWVRADQVVPIDRAIDYYTEQIRADPKSAHAYLCRGAVREAMDQTDAALADYNEAIRLAPDYVAALNNRGTIWLEKGRPGDAVADFTRALQLKPDYVPALFNRGVALAGLGYHPRAVADFTRALRLERGDRGIFFYRGLSLLETGDNDRAVADFTEAIRLDPKRWEAPALLARGTALGRKREYEKALGDFEFVIRLDPRSPMAHNNLAYILATCPDPRFRDGRKAVAAARQACALAREDDPGFLATLAAAYAEAGDFPRAVESQEKANALVSDEEPKRIGEERLALYRAGRPYRDGPDGGPR